MQQIPNTESINEICVVLLLFCIPGITNIFKHYKYILEEHGRSEGCCDSPVLKAVACRIEEFYLINNRFLVCFSNALDIIIWMNEVFN